jgi:SAM-dependent methyltransferase
MTDQGTEGLLSPFLRRKRIKAVRPFLRGLVLDVGCGTGELARLVSSDSYYGFDRDQDSINIAHQQLSNHQFHTRMPDQGRFDTVVALAVIEHSAEPESFLRNLCLYLRPDLQSRIILTTPHPKLEWAHDLGARLGLFSLHASEEHETLFDRASLQSLAEAADCPVLLYKRFLLGANQLIVLKPQLNESSGVRSAGEGISQLVTGYS